MQHEKMLLHDAHYQRLSCTGPQLLQVHKLNHPGHAACSDRVRVGCAGGPAVRVRVLGRLRVRVVQRAVAACTWPEKGLPQCGASCVLLYKEVEQHAGIVAVVEWSTHECVSGVGSNTIATRHNRAAGSCTTACAQP